MTGSFRPSLDFATSFRSLSIYLASQEPNSKSFGPIAAAWPTAAWAKSNKPESWNYLATVPVDEVYGIMAASGIEIVPIPKETKEQD